MEFTPVLPQDDFFNVTDEELVALRRLFFSDHALEVLLERSLAWIRSLLAYRIQRGLLRVDLADAIQTAYLAVLEAIQAYDLRQGTTPGGCHFRSFFGVVAWARLTDEDRRQATYDSHVQRTTLWDEALESRADHDYQAEQDYLLLERQEDDPGRTVERDEFRQRLQAVLGRLDENLAWLWEERSRGIPLRVTARHMGLSKPQVKRLWKRLKKTMRRRFPEFCVEGG
jgi:RNA polymerase sigma factor (sigma-70 family)